MPGGLIIISDIFFDDTSKLSPTFATLFALTMRLTSKDGAAHAITDLEDWMSKLGFLEIRKKPFSQPMTHIMISGSKPLKDLPGGAR